jgi:hypothetical protein
MLACWHQYRRCVPITIIEIAPTTFNRFFGAVKTFLPLDGEGAVGGKD